MLTSKSFLALDFGAGSLKVAEFEITEDGVLRLRRHALKALGLEGSQQTKRDTVLQQSLRAVLAKAEFAARDVNVSAPGFHVFSKFVKLPPVDTSKVTQIIQYEAQQNVPFPLEEVVWDYQILGTTPTGELEVLLVAIKADIVEGLFRTSEAAGLRLQLVDVSPAALCNAFRYNYGDLDGCTMLLDIGAKTSNVLFFERGKVYSRSINIGANSITQDFATESKLPFAEAEKFKIEEGFVSLGGAYEEPDNPRQAQISKIARQVMTRLHIQVNQTIQFYRGQQGGSAPQRLFLSGGASVMPYTAQFFAEKLNLTVDYFNPLRNIQIDPAINLEELAKVAHGYGEVVGIALRNLAQCPIELNLMPKSSLKQQALARKKPYFIAALVSLVLVALAIGWFSYRITADRREAFNQFNAMLAQPQKRAFEFEAVRRRIHASKQDVDQLTGWLQSKIYWNELLAELRRKFIETEQLTEKKQSVDAGVWIETLSAGNAVTLGTTEVAYAEEGPTHSAPMDERMARYEHLRRRTSPLGLDGALGGAADKSATSSNEMSVIKLTCRARNLMHVSPDANTHLMYDLQSQLQSCTNLFAVEGTNSTQLIGTISPVTISNLTFSFEVQLKLKQPLRLTL